jgi:oligopeptide transport system substrate-binding protein
LQKVILWVLLILCGCSTPKKSSSNINISFIKDPTTLDPRKAADLFSTSTVFLLYEGLFRSGKNGDIENAVCDHYEISKDQKRYRFFLKKTKWSDGSNVTAYDFENAFKSQLEPDFTSPYSYLFFCIKNAKAFKNNQCSSQELGIRVIDELTLEILLEYPKSDFIALLSFSPFFPYKNDDLSKLFNGPFYLQKRILHKEWKLKKNPFYHDCDKVSLSSINIKIIESETTGIRLFEEGKLDILGGPLSPLPLDEPFEDKSPLFHPMAGSTLCVFNTNSWIFKNVNIRKAFALAVDQSKLIKGQSKTKTKPLSFIPSLLIGQNSSPFFQKNDENPKAYLEIGLQELNLKKEELNKLTYYFGSKPEHTKSAQILKEIWKASLGVEINLQKLEHKCLAEKIAEKQFDFAQLIWLAPYFSPNALLDRFKENKGSKNFSSFASTELTNLITKLEKENGDSLETLGKIETIFQENIPYIPLYDWQYPYLVSKKIKNISFTNVGTLNLTFLELANDSCE